MEATRVAKFILHLIFHMLPAVNTDAIIPHLLSWCIENTDKICMTEQSPKINVMEFLQCGLTTVLETRLCAQNIWFDRSEVC